MSDVTDILCFEELSQGVVSAPHSAGWQPLEPIPPPFGSATGQIFKLHVNNIEPYGIIS